VSAAAAVSLAALAGGRPRRATLLSEDATLEDAAEDLAEAAKERAERSEAAG
jgi:hypothetical protein